MLTDFILFREPCKAFDSVVVKEGRRSTDCESPHREGDSREEGGYLVGGRRLVLFDYRLPPPSPLPASPIALSVYTPCSYSIYESKASQRGQAGTVAGQAFFAGPSKSRG